VSSPVRTCTSVLLYLLSGEFCLVYSAKLSLEITVVNLLLKGEKVKYDQIQEGSRLFYFHW